MAHPEELLFQAGLLDALEQSVIVTDLDWAITYWNRFAETLFGWSSAEAVGRNVRELLLPDMSPAASLELITCLSAGKSSSGECVVQRRDGTQFLLHTTTSPLRDGAGVLVGVIGLSSDVTEGQRAGTALAHQALHDGLTGLPNRGLLHTRLQQALASEHSPAHGVSLLLLDLDRFKEVNDTLGHHIGDVLLRQIGQRLQGAVRATDLVARLGGDEFAVLLPASTAEGAAEVAEVLVCALQTPFMLEGQPIAVDVSIGIAVAPDHGLDADTLLRCADVAMYQAKRSGTGVALYRAAEDEHRPDRLALLGELRNAIDNDELLLHYQPKLDLHTGSLVGVEALVRWQHPQHGFMPPSEFIPLAEQTGVIYPLSRWVLDAAIKQHRLWRDAGLDVQVAINLSRRMLHDPELSDVIAQSLARWGVAPGAVVLEITESSLMADPVRTGVSLTQLRALGVRISIDDFGTGYSSLASLKNLSVDELKIDQSFVQAMATDASSRAIVRAIVDLADALKLRVVAEGVEDRASWDVLAGLGCEVAQGYFVSRPIGAAELEAWVRRLSPSWLAGRDRSGVEDALQERIRGRGARLIAEEEFIARKGAETALRASEERYRLALQATAMGTWEWDPFRDVQIWSPETEALHGLAPGTFGGNFAALKRAIHPDDWSAFVLEAQASQAERRDSLATYRTIWPDGSVHWLENKGRAVYAADGTLVRGTGTSVDITERRRSEDALRASEERFRRQYKGLPIPTNSWLQAGDDFVLQDYNDASELITEGHIRTLLGQSASSIYPEAPEILADLQLCAAEHRTLRREMSYTFQATRRTRRLALTYVFVPPGTVMLHTEDITETWQAEQQREAMVQSEKLRALGQMATGIAHDLNQSLMLVASYSDLAEQALLAEPPDLAALKELLSTTTRAALDGGESVKRLLLFTRATPEREGQPVDLSNVVREAALLTAPRWRDAAQAEGRPISLLVDVQAQPTIHGSPARLRDLMTNLIFNAVDALPAGGTIRVRVGVEDGQAVIEVADSGVGMSPEVQARVFEPFFTTKGERGTGLGLSMVFGIVEQHAGRISIHSAVGAGTTLHITLPLAVTALALVPDGPADTAPAPVSVAPPSGLRVLAVDDEPLMTRALVRMLRPAGHQVVVAASGEEALEKLAQEQFDVVVSDMGMGPGMNGWELADAVRRRWPSTRFLLATGWGAAIDPNEARSRGVEAVLAKPYHRHELVDALVGTAGIARAA